MILLIAPLSNISHIDVQSLRSNVFLRSINVMCVSALYSHRISVIYLKKNTLSERDLSGLIPHGKGISSSQIRSSLKNIPPVCCSSLYPSLFPILNIEIIGAVDLTPEIYLSFQHKLQKYKIDSIPEVVLRISSPYVTIVLLVGLYINNAFISYSVNHIHI